MRRLILLVTFSCLLISCDKEPKPELVPFDVISVSKLINKNFDIVRESCKNYEKLEESIDPRLGASLLYIIPEIEGVKGRFYLDLRFNSSNILKDILLYPEENSTLTQGIELTRALSDEIASEYTSYSYYGFNSKSFSSRAEFWTYAANNPVKDDTVEQWWKNQSGYSIIIYLNYYYASGYFRLSVSQI